MIPLWLALAAAHPLAPSALNLTEAPDGVVAVWRTPTTRPVGQDLAPTLPCDPVGEATVARDGEALVTTWRLGCSALGGRTAGVLGLEPGGTQALLQWTAGGREGTALLTADRPELALPHAPGRWDTAVAGFGLGVAHLLGGADHLLFLLGLALLVPGRRLVWAITAFTGGHAVSLGLGGTGSLSLPGGPVELAIAASLLWLALEVWDGSGTGALARWPALVCLPVGLVHGLGFAGAWQTSGLAGEGPALLGFNLGIEVAQLGVLAAWVVALAAVGEPSTRARVGLAVAGGSVAAMWVWERALALVLQ